MPEEKQQSQVIQDYKQGFNNGYWIATKSPGLVPFLTEIKSNSPIVEGLRDGIAQVELKKQRALQKDGRQVPTEREQPTAIPRMKGKDVPPGR